MRQFLCNKGYDFATGGSRSQFAGVCVNRDGNEGDEAAAVDEERRTDAEDAGAREDKDERDRAPTQAD